jgi:hypothetical protein
MRAAGRRPCILPPEPARIRSTKAGAASLGDR